MANMLVIDWDFFFPNPMENLDSKTPDWQLYDWGHKEAPLFIEMIWPIRAAAFLTNNLPLPTMNDEWETFWDRVTLHPDATLYLSDSNTYSGTITTTPNGEPITHVTLYDAHHDSGYNQTYEEFITEGTFECENWMLTHYMRGVTDLNLYYPRWKTNAFTVEPEPAIPINRQFDTGENPNTVFDIIHICRSGAWVPSWCDTQFQQFYETAPTHSQLQLDTTPLHRNFDTTQAESYAKQILTISHPKNK